MYDRTGASLRPGVWAIMRSLISSIVNPFRLAEQFDCGASGSILTVYVQ